MSEPTVLDHYGIKGDVVWDRDKKLWKGCVRGTDMTFQSPHWPDIIAVFHVAAEQVLNR